jgi:hypothetical protein
MWLANIMKAIQFTNIRKGMWLIKLVKNQKVFESEVSMSAIAWIQSALSAMYGPIIKLKTVIGIRITKYNFSVLVRVLNDT